LFFLSPDSIANITMQLDLQSTEDAEHMPDSVLISDEGICIAGSDGLYPLLFPSWMMMSHYMGGVDIDRYVAKPPAIDMIPISCTILGPLR